MGRHIEMLAKHWRSISLPFDRIVFCAPLTGEGVDLSGNDSISQEPHGETTIEFLPMPAPVPNLIWEQAVLPKAARKSALLFCPSYTCPLIYNGRIVLANHGIYEALPQEFPLMERLRATPINWLSARRADHVIANSLSTKGDLVKFFGLSPEKLSVVLPAASDLCWETYSPEEIRDEVVRHLGADVPYVVFVGKMAKRRHVPNLIQAFDRVKKEHALPHRLLLVGPNTSDQPIEQYIDAAGGADVVRWTKHLEMLPLAKIYAGAEVYSLPTTYEGISQTMFEAMASGAAVLTVEHPVLAEGGGDAVLAVRTPSVDDLAAGLEKLLLDKPFRLDLVARARQRAALFSWRKTAEQTMAILDRIALKQDP